MANIVQSLFGSSVADIQAKQQADQQARAAQYANMDANQQINYAGYQAGGMLGQGLAGAMGYQDPSVIAAQRAEKLAAESDLSTSAKAFEAAQRAQAQGMTDVATKLVMYAKDLQSKETLSDLQTEQANKLRNEKPKLNTTRMDGYTVLHDPYTGKEIKRWYDIQKPDTKGGKGATEQDISRFSVLTDSLRKTYDKLLANGGITTTSKSGLANLAAATSSSGLGQAVGASVGQENAKLRQDIATMRPMLLQSLAKALGMTSKAMDSNTELQMYLQAATNPKSSYETNIEQLQRLDEWVAAAKQNPDAVENNIPLLGGTAPKGGWSARAKP